MFAYEQLDKIMNRKAGHFGIYGQDDAIGIHSTPLVKSASFIYSPDHCGILKGIRDDKRAEKERDQAKHICAALFLMAIGLDNTGRRKD